MKKDNNKVVYVLNYFAAICFYIVSIMDFLSHDTRRAILYFCLGTVDFCIGTIWLKKDKKNK